MKRQDIEKIMKQKKQKYIVLYYNEGDKLGKLCSLSGGILMNYSGHRVPLKQDIWGYDNNGRVSFETLKTEI